MAEVFEHDAVLLDEAVKALVEKPGGFYVDGTYGRGGHSGEILKRLNQAGRLLVVDKDPEAIHHAQQYLGADSRVMISHTSFAAIGDLVCEWGVAGKVDGVLLDLGVSSPQIDNAERGFSFKGGPLDMRMNPEIGMSAADWIAVAKEREIADVIKRYGEERFANRMARAIVEERARKPIVTTEHLADIVSKANPAWEKGKNPATRAFQAIRIFINNELDDLNRALDQALEVLAVGGKLVVISFHSLEDRIVKRFIRLHEKGEQLPRDLPITADQVKQRLRHVGKIVRASDEEIAGNVRARSAVMRIAVKVS
jgi:16S rRNA (cytosine1402-N4)-methyltransferase